jgi:UDP-N-acetylglucosamine transferase subunit ALG13
MVKSTFVTVGNGKFDPLIKEIDRLKGEGKIKENVVVQLGHGSYIPKHCNWFKFESPLTKYYKKADLIISHGGPGIVFEVLRMKKKLIALPNRDRTDPMHQVEYLRAIAKETSALLYCDRVGMLFECLKRAKTHKFATYHPKICNMGEEVNKFLGNEL